MRRYEILIPLFHNDGSPQSIDVIDNIITDVQRWFGGITVDREVVGEWANADGEVVEDKLIRLTADAGNEAHRDSEGWLRLMKYDWKADLRQDDIWITFYDVTVI